MSNNNVICTICAERYRNSDNIHAGSCGHAFHEECLYRWWEQSRTCPICRSKDAAYFQLYLSFENDGAGGGESGSGQNQSQDNTSRSSSSPSNSASSSSNSNSSSNSSSNSARNSNSSNSNSARNSNSNSSSNSARNSNSSTSSTSTSSTTNNNNSRGSTRDLSMGFMREYEILLYEKDLYQQEIEYLNHRIGQLSLRNSNLNCRLAESESDTDSD